MKGKVTKIKGMGRTMKRNRGKEGMGRERETRGAEGRGRRTKG